MQVTLIWNLTQTEEAHTLERHCSTCGRTTTFTDTGKKRRNANGKNIFEYTIYRCEKGHRWNQKTRQYKASQYGVPYKAGHNGNGENGSRQTIQAFALSYYRSQGMTTIAIRLESVEGVWRLDKVLSEHITDLSRAEIRRMIKAGQILFDRKEIKPGARIKREGTIEIHVF